MCSQLIAKKPLRERMGKELRTISSDGQWLLLGSLAYQLGYPTDELWDAFFDLNNRELNPDHTISIKIESYQPKPFDVDRSGDIGNGTLVIEAIHQGTIYVHEDWAQQVKALVRNGVRRIIKKTHWHDGGTECHESPLTACRERDDGWFETLAMVRFC